MKAISYLHVAVNAVPGGLDELIESSSTFGYWYWAILSKGDTEALTDRVDYMFNFTGDSIFYYKKFISEFWAQKKYDQIVKFFEKNKPEIIRYTNFDLNVTFEIPYSYWVIGYLDKARLSAEQILGMLQNNFDKTKTGYMKNISLAYLYADEKDYSLDWLEKAIDLYYLDDITTDIFYEPLYDHPRFLELATRQQKKKEEALALVASYNFPEPEDLPKKYGVKWP